jgi:hypothetical protein
MRNPDLVLSIKLPIIFTQWYYNSQSKAKAIGDAYPLEDLSHREKKKKLLFGKSSGCKSVAHVMKPSVIIRHMGKLQESRFKNESCYV